MTAPAAPPPHGPDGRPQWRAATALALALALVAAPNAIGLLARLSGVALRRFWAWWPPTSLEPLPLGVAAVAIVATAYALATHGNRMRSPDLPGRRRFLPPLDLLLLQLGNVTFLAFALILAIVTVGFLSYGLRALVSARWLVANALGASLAAALAGALFGLRSPRSAQPGNGRRRQWSRRAAILGGAVAGFWLVSRAPEQGYLTIRLADSQVDASRLAGLFALLWILLSACLILVRVERSGAAATRSVTTPLTWATYVGFLALYLHGAFLTLRTHLAVP